MLRAHVQDELLGLEPFVQGDRKLDARAFLDLTDLGVGTQVSRP
jgi:hypothetical protein